MSLIKYIKPAKFDTEMFVLEKLDKKQEKLLKIRKYKDTNFVFIKANRICSSNLKRNCTYKIEAMETNIYIKDDKVIPYVDNYLLKLVKESPFYKKMNKMDKKDLSNFTF